MCSSAFLQFQTVLFKYCVGLSIDCTVLIVGNLGVIKKVRKTRNLLYQK